MEPVPSLLTGLPFAGRQLDENELASIRLSAILVVAQSYSPAARSSIQKFDNDYDVIFMTYKCDIA